MNINEILQAKGITEEVIQAILDEMRANKIFTASEENLDIRYGKLKTQNDSNVDQLNKANATIAELQKANKGNEQLQQTVTNYQAQLAQMQEKLKQTELDAAIKVELLSSKAVDVDYLTYKLNEKAKADGEELVLDDAGKIKGWSDKLAGLKTQFPHMFEAGGESGGYQVLDPNKLHSCEPGDVIPNKETFKQWSYEKRLELKQKNEQAYQKLAK